MLRKRLLFSRTGLVINPDKLSFDYGVDTTIDVDEYGYVVGYDQVVSVNNESYYVINSPASSYESKEVIINFKTTKDKQHIVINAKCSSNDTARLVLGKLDSDDPEDFAFRHSSTNIVGYVYLVPKAGEHFIRIYIKEDNNSKSESGYFRLTPFKNAEPIVYQPNSQEVTIIAKDNWTITSIPSWVYIGDNITSGSVGEHKLNIYAQVNTGSARSSNIVFDVNGEKFNLQIEQSARPSKAYVSSMLEETYINGMTNALTYNETDDSNSDTFKVNLENGNTWELTCSAKNNWLSYNKTSGKNGDKIKLTWNKNSSSLRYNNIKIKSNTGAESIIAVSQKADWCSCDAKDYCTTDICGCDTHCTSHNDCKSYCAPDSCGSNCSPDTKCSSYCKSQCLTNGTAYKCQCDYDSSTCDPYCECQGNGECITNCGCEGYGCESNCSKNICCEYKICTPNECESYNMGRGCRTDCACDTKCTCQGNCNVHCGAKCSPDCNSNTAECACQEHTETVVTCNIVDSVRIDALNKSQCDPEYCDSESLCQLYGYYYCECKGNYRFECNCDYNSGCSVDGGCSSECECQSQGSTCSCDGDCTSECATDCTLDCSSDVGPVCPSKACSPKEICFCDGAQFTPVCDAEFILAVTDLTLECIIDKTCNSHCEDINRCNSYEYCISEGFLSQACGVNNIECMAHISCECNNYYVKCGCDVVTTTTCAINCDRDEGAGTESCPTNTCLCDGDGYCYTKGNVLCICDADDLCNLHDDSCIAYCPSDNCSCYTYAYNALIDKNCYGYCIFDNAVESRVECRQYCESQHCNCDGNCTGYTCGSNSCYADCTDRCECNNESIHTCTCESYSYPVCTGNNIGPCTCYSQKICISKTYEECSCNNVDEPVCTKTLCGCYNDVIFK